MEDRYFKIYLKLFSAGALLGCHQKPERSFFIGNWQFPVCSRCTGVFAGQLLMVILLMLGVRTHLRTDLIFLFIMFLDWFIQYLGILYSTNGRRVVTGILAGLAMTGIYFKIICFVFRFAVKLL